ncbi:MAG: phosphodiester glycosidase family protein [Acidimicrobiales bacterium]
MAGRAAGRRPRAARPAPLVYTTFVQPSAEYSSLVTGLAWLDPKRVRLELYSGTEQPGGPGWNLTAPFPLSVRPSLIAAFNSGFKLSDSHGGYVAEGRQAPGRSLVNGQAALVIYKDGTATVGAWGRDAQMGPDVEAVRQNLVLLVDNGQEAPDLDRDSLVRWGFTPGNKTFVWRSGVGVDAHGHLIYAAGQLTIHALADVLQAAGAVRAMELDINSTWVHFFTYHDAPGAAGGTAGGRLLPQMSASTDEYFRSSSRDFFAAFAR